MNGLRENIIGAAIDVHKALGPGLLVPVLKKVIKRLVHKYKETLCELSVSVVKRDSEHLPRRVWRSLLARFRLENYSLPLCPRDCASSGSESGLETSSRKPYFINL